MSAAPQVSGSAAEGDSLRAVLDSVFARQEYQWVESPRPFAFLARWWYALQEWLAGLERAHPQLYWTLFWLMIALLVVIFLHGVWVMARTLRAAAAPPAGAQLGGPEARGAGWYRAEAARLAAIGRFAEAMQAEFVALVLDLDARRVLRFHPSKTPHEYSEEPGLAGDAREAFHGLVRSLYGYAFARWPCGLAEYQAWQAAARPERYAAAG